MCIPQAPAKKRQPRIRRKERTKKSIPFNKELMKPDPDFVDERITKEPRQKSVWQRISKIFG